MAKKGASKSSKKNVDASDRNKRYGGPLKWFLLVSSVLLLATFLYFIQVDEREQVKEQFENQASGPFLDEVNDTLCESKERRGEYKIKEQLKDALSKNKKVVILFMIDEIGNVESRYECGGELYGDWAYNINNFDCPDCVFLKADPTNLEADLFKGFAPKSPYSLLFVKEGHPALYYEEPILEDYVYNFIDKVFFEDNGGEKVTIADIMCGRDPSPSCEEFWAEQDEKNAPYNLDDDPMRNEKFVELNLE